MGQCRLRRCLMSQQPVRQAARRSALNAQAALRKERAERERRLEGLAVAVLTALGERDALVRDAERRAGQALRTMTDDEGLSLREAVDWCGGVTVREITRLLRLAPAEQSRPRRTTGWQRWSTPLLARRVLRLARRQFASSNRVPRCVRCAYASNSPAHDPCAARWQRRR